ncbi:unnamed protein product, partial [Prorocentrum cordatum]
PRTAPAPAADAAGGLHRAPALLPAALPVSAPSLRPRADFGSGLKCSDFDAVRHPRVAQLRRPFGGAPLPPTTGQLGQASEGGDDEVVDLPDEAEAVASLEAGPPQSTAPRPVPIDTAGGAAQPPTLDVTVEVPTSASLLAQPPREWQEGVGAAVGAAAPQPSFPGGAAGPPMQLGSAASPGSWTLGLDDPAEAPAAAASPRHAAASPGTPTTPPHTLPVAVSPLAAALADQAAAEEVPLWSPPHPPASPPGTAASGAAAPLPSAAWGASAHVGEQLRLLGFPDHQVVEATRRCSTIEAAVEWIFRRSRSTAKIFT